MRVLSNLAKLINPSREELDMMEQRLHLKVLRKNDHFVRQGHVSGEVALVEKGTMRLYVETAEKEICKDFLFENAVACSYDSLFFGQASRVGIQALQETHLLVLSNDDFHYLYAHCPAWHRFWNLLVVEQLMKTDYRETALLKDPPDVRFRNILEEHPLLFSRIPLQYIASYLGITRETLSRYRSRI
ncbi:cAMP-binding domain of CRP or a regulatory subunit of cAMP-dependent protein kinases [Dyadobacter sp. SG02]|uniref:Crp/Fnr family transcriptional regulator n=1 Tax=Dyadobacter sp. SG02 TaxID=1855291 RepID=UPI0008B5235E|nr:Crp/Fnr family transcriptional regulator [Dyadobacter sp. SG02]SEI58858.1 cAMP-binding domain of CRP or a regulatory subunit of cAMP-dependent protein kinases [Dyadobacter sp. SG02]